MRPGRVAGLAAGLLLAFFVVTVAVPPDRVRIDRLLVLTVVVFAAFTARRRFGTGTRPEPEAPAFGSGESTAAQEQDVMLARMDASLAQAAESPQQFWRVTRPAVRRLATERLRLRRGIDVTADPDGARRQMGEELWEMFATPPGHVGPAPGRDRLRALVERLERL